MSPPRILIVKGRCPISLLLENALNGCDVTIAELGQELPRDFHDIEIVETHLISEEWKRLWEIERDWQADQRVHICLMQPISAIICRNVLEEYRRRRTS